MQARIVGIQRGARWLGEGWQLFRGAPLGWLALVFAYWLLMTFASLLPLVGVVIAPVLVPAFSVGFMAAARAVGGGQRLGLAYLACLALVLSGTTLADDGALAQWMTTGQRPSEDVLQSDTFFAALACAALFYVPVMMMFWFAPPLAAWHATGAGKALFFSFFACLMNWRAFLAYGTMTAAVSLVLPFLALSGLMLASGGALAVPVVSLAFPLLMLLLPTLFASFYASYRDVFASQ